MKPNDADNQTANLGARHKPRVHVANFPTADDIVQHGREQQPRPGEAVDVLLVNPPTPDGGLWIRTQHRVGRRSRENMVWPQVSLAQMAALLHPDYSVKVLDANAERMGWPEFTLLLDKFRPRYFVTQVTAPTLENDMRGCFLARARGAKTIAFGTHVTPLPRETMAVYPALDFVLVGEPDLTLRDLLDHLEGRFDERSSLLRQLFAEHDAAYQPGKREDGSAALDEVKGLAWRRNGKVVVNVPRPFIANLDRLPMPMHELLPLQQYRMPLIKGPFTFVVTSRGCPAGCTFCIKHVSYQYTTRLRSPALLVEEMWHLKQLGIHNLHMYADLFTVNRDQVVDLCRQMIDEGLDVRWTCNSRVDYVDEEMLGLMAQAGCWYISWGIESANEQVLRRAHKGISPERAERALRWARNAGIKNWGYFIIGLPGETEESIRQTIAFAKKLPLDIALFHVAAPYPGTPFFFEVVEKGWFRPGTRWEQVDMDRETVLDYPGLPAEQLLYWQKRAFREWAVRPGPLFTYLKMLLSDRSTFRTALSVGLQHLSWIGGDKEPLASGQHG